MYNSKNIKGTIPCPLQTNLKKCLCFYRKIYVYNKGRALLIFNKTECIPKTEEVIAQVRVSQFLFSNPVQS